MFPLIFNFISLLLFNVIAAIKNTHSQPPFGYGNLTNVKTNVGTIDLGNRKKCTDIPNLFTDSFTLRRLTQRLGTE